MAPSTFFEALCLGQEIAQRDVAGKRIDIFTELFRKDFGQLFVEVQKALVNDYSDQGG